MRTALLALATLAAGPALAADDPSPRIVVSGTASVNTPPDRAILEYGLHGEGATTDEAVAALAAKRKAVEAGLAAMAAQISPRATQIAIAEVRGSQCGRQSYGAPRLAVGDCAIVGYAADLSMEVRTSAVKEAGTIVGLIGRLGGTNPRLARFALSDDGAPQARALAAALAQARRQAEAIAAGAKVALGRLLSVSNAGYGMQPSGEDIIVTASAVAPPPPPPPAPPPIEVTLTPRPIETQARVTVVYAIGP